MKRIFTLIVSSIIALISYSQETVEVVTGAGYVNEVHYSFEGGVVKSSPRTDWDIAFTTSQFDISILANNGAGVELYTYPGGDTSSWNSIDTTGMVWTQMYNSIETWTEGAFVQNIDPNGPFDYGWGEYNTMNHHIVGDSLYIIKTTAGTFRKLWIIDKDAFANIWYFKFADIDGSNEQDVTLDANSYTSRNFVGYSIEYVQEVDMEPASDDWDLLFTKYFDSSIPYFVTGVLSNESHVMLQEVQETGMDQSTFENYDEGAFDWNISTIGSDWKTFNGSTFSYDLATEVMYFAKLYYATDSAYWKLYFTGFDGSSTGRYEFVQEFLSGSSAVNEINEGLLEVFPNPATDFVTVVYDYTGEVEINILDASGRLMKSENISLNGFSNHKIDISELINGLYFIQIVSGNQTRINKVIKK